MGVVLCVRGGMGWGGMGCGGYLCDTLTCAPEGDYFVRHGIMPVLLHRGMVMGALLTLVLGGPVAVMPEDLGMDSLAITDTWQPEGKFLVRSSRAL